ncbi:MAG: serine O-acetyltransferase [Planctomycetota bacterium]
MPADADCPERPCPDTLEALTGTLAQAYLDDETTQHIGATFLPNRAKVIEFIEALRRLTFPGFFDAERIEMGNVKDHTRATLLEVDGLLYEQTRQALRYELNRKRDGVGDDCDDCDVKAREITNAFLAKVPDVRRLLSTDVQAAYDGDPATTHPDEAIFCYPGLDAIFTYRYAHALCELGVPMIPRMMTEAAHNDTGIDIHPGATIGERLFIDHGTGIVVGETTVIGRDVKLYQGVTLGALSLKGGHDQWAGKKRHPTIEDGVTIYGGAIILGGETVIGQGATIGGSVFITQSVPAGHTVVMKSPQLKSIPPKEQRDPQAAAVAFDPGI